MNNVTKDTNLTQVIMNGLIGWLVDSDMPSPINIVCDATLFDVGVLAPQVDQHGHIVLNISGQATKDFRYHEHSFSFKGWKGGPVPLDVPYEAVLGMLIQVDEAHSAFIQIPNLKRLQGAVDHNKLLVGKLRDAAKPINPERMAVFDPTEKDVSEQPNHRELMERLPLNDRPVAAVKDTPAPLLDFGPVGGLSISTGRSRHSTKPKLTVIKGGKA